MDEGQNQPAELKPPQSNGAVSEGKVAETGPWTSLSQSQISSKTSVVLSRVESCTFSKAQKFENPWSNYFKGPAIGFDKTTQWAGSNHTPI